MKSFANEEEQFASLLRARLPALPDDGFSQRVVAQLPVPRRPYRGLAWGSGGAIVGAVFAIGKGAAWSGPAHGGWEWNTSFAPAAASVANPWLLLTLGVTGFSLLIAYTIARLHAQS